MSESESWQSGQRWPGPAHDTIDLWRVTLGERAADWNVLSDDEQARAQLLLIDQKRSQFVSARAALRRILARTLGRDPAALRFTCSEHGRPELVDAGQLRFNLSHSHQLALIAVADAVRIGVDIERSISDCAFADIARQHFAEVERQVLESLPPAAQPAFFWRVWTLKEAFLKARGTGLSVESRRCAIAISDAGAPYLLHSELPGDDQQRWNLRDVELASGYTAAVCWEGAPREVRRWQQIDASRSRPGAVCNT